MEELTKREIRDISENRYIRDRKYRIFFGLIIGMGALTGGVVLKDEGGLLQIPGYILISLALLLAVYAGLKFYKGSTRIKEDLLKKGVIYHGREE